MGTWWRPKRSLHFLCSFFPTFFLSFNTLFACYLSRDFLNRNNIIGNRNQGEGFLPIYEGQFSGNNHCSNESESSEESAILTAEARTKSGSASEGQRLGMMTHKAKEVKSVEKSGKFVPRKVAKKLEWKRRQKDLKVARLNKKGKPVSSWVPWRPLVTFYPQW